MTWPPTRRRATVRKPTARPPHGPGWHRCHRPDPEPYAGSRRNPGSVRGIGYMLLSIVPMMTLAVTTGQAREGQASAGLSGGHLIPLVLSLMAWWALSIARRRETWNRRQLVREVAAASAADGIPRVVEASDPDPYPNAALRVGTQVGWGLVLAIAPLATALVAAFARDTLVMGRALVLAPAGLIFGGWLLRIAQARSRYAARQQLRAAAAASGQIVPPNGDYVADPEPFAAIRVGPAILRRLQRFLVVVGCVLVALSSVSLRRWAPGRSAAVPGLSGLAVLNAAAFLLMIVRRKEEWVFRVRARAAVLQAAYTRVGVVGVSLDPSWEAGTLAAPRSKLIAMALLPLALIGSALLTANNPVLEDIVVTAMALSPLALATLTFTYFWERKRQRRAAAAQAGLLIPRSNSQT
ncbi:MAG: hypothetical protein IPN45_08100 [Actinomycetales bacterium]|nr:hypothetical protein [Actinomycetales bacterium]